MLLDVALGHIIPVAATVLFGCLKWRHRAAVAAKDDAFEQPFHSLDFTYSYSPLDNMTVKLGLKNLLDEQVEILQQGEILQQRTEGQSYSLSFSYKY